ncbi:VOC family protein [Micromonospora sp. NPDC093277]|uniref:VOC family protein n=1 Tax=Micromonospora sp. NPDC093277 TaxID=3364291 RepID=UPI0037FD6882
MTPELKTVIFPVRDLGQAKAVYGALLGVPPYTDEAYYVGFRVGDQELGLDPNGHRQGMTGAVGYWEVADIAATIEAVTEAGGTLQGEVRDVGGGMLIATVRDADGNGFGLRQTP